MLSLEELIESVGWDVTPTGCWEWRGHRAHGYAAITSRAHGLTHASVHRLMYRLRVGPIPEGQVVRHYVCDNPPCVNPEHLRAGTQAENVRDREERGRGRYAGRTHCDRGHPVPGPGGCKECRRLSNLAYRSR